MPAEKIKETGNYKAWNNLKHLPLPGFYLNMSKISSGNFYFTCHITFLILFHSKTLLKINWTDLVLFTLFSCDADVKPQAWYILTAFTILSVEWHITETTETISFYIEIVTHMRREYFTLKQNVNVQPRSRTRDHWQNKIFYH